MNESGIEGGSGGISVGIGKSSAQLGIVGSNPQIVRQKEESPKRGDSRKGVKGQQNNPKREN
jgi:hypothetical protein